MSPEDLDKAADALKEAYYKDTLWAFRNTLPLPTIANNLLANPRAIGGAFVWEEASEIIREKGIPWKWNWFSEYVDLLNGDVISKGAAMVVEVLKRLRAPQKEVSLEDYM